MASEFQIAGQLVIQSAIVDNKVFSDIRSRLDKLPTQKVKVLAEATEQAAASTNKLNKSQDQAARSGQRAARGIQQTANAVQDFGDKAGLALRRFTAFTIAATGVFGSLRVIRQGLGDAIAFNRELTKVAQVTGQSINSLRGLRNEIGALSSEFGTSSQDLVGVARTLSQAGLTARETEKSLRALAKTTLAPTFTDISKTTEGAIASLRQFNLAAEDLEGTFGIINAVAGKFAVESDDIITAIRKSGAAFSAANQGIKSGNESLAEFIALFTSVRATTRESADTIGTGLRTIFTRIQRPETIQFLRQFGVELTDLQGKFVGPFEAIRRLGDALKDLSPRDTRFATIVEEVGGFRQVSRVIPLIQQTTLQAEALNVALAGQESLSKDAAVAQQDLAVQIAQVKQEFATLLRDIANTDTFQSFVKTSLELAKALIQVADAAKETIPLLAALAAIRGIGAVAGGLQAFGTRVVTGSAGIPTRRQRGGIVGGLGEGDKIPALLEPGEFVLNRKAVNAIGLNDLEKANDAFPRFGRKKFQSGGIAKLVTGGNPGITGNFANFAGNTEFRAGIELVISELSRLGFSAEQISSTLNDAARGAKGPGEALANVFNKLLSTVENYDRKLVRSQQQFNSGTLGIPVGQTSGTNTVFAGAFPRRLALPAPVDDATRIANAIENRLRIQEVINPPARTVQVIGNLEDDASRIINGRGQQRRNPSQEAVDRINQRAAARSEDRLAQLRRATARGFFTSLDRRRNNFDFFLGHNLQPFLNEGRRPDSVVGLTRDDFDPNNFQGQFTTSQRTEVSPRRAEAIRRARNIARIRRLRELRSAGIRGARFGGIGLALAATQVDQESALGRGVQSGLLAGVSASFLGLGPVGAAAVGVGAGVNTVLGARQNEREAQNLEKLNRSTENLVQAFNELGNSAKDIAKLQGLRDENNLAFNNFVSLQGSRATSNLGGLLANIGSPEIRFSSLAGRAGNQGPILSGGSDADVNSRIALSRGNASFFTSRTAQVLDPFGGIREFFGAGDADINIEDIRALRRLDISEAEERATKRTPTAEAARNRIERLLRSGTDVSDIDNTTLIESVSDRVALQREGVTDSARRAEGERSARQLSKAIDLENDAREKIINALREFSSEITTITNSLEKADDILSLSSQTNQLFSGNSIALAGGGALNFQRANVFANAAAFSRDQLIGAAGNIGSFFGGQLNPDIVNRAASVRDIRSQIRDLELAGDTGEDVQGRIEELELQADAAQKAADTLSNFEDAINKSISTLQQELSVRRNLVRESDELSLTALGAAGSFAERRAGLIGRENRFTGRGAVLQGQIQSLTGGPTDVQSILRNIQDARQARLNNAGSNRTPFQKAIEDSRLVENLERNTRALQILSTDISDLTDIQNKLSEIQRQREGGSNLIGDVAGLDFDQARERFRQLSAFNIFTENRGDLKALAGAGFTSQDALAGLQLRKNALSQLGLTDEADDLQTQFNRNFFRSQGILNTDQLRERFGNNVAERLIPSLTFKPRFDQQGNLQPGTGSQRERELLQQADEIGKRQVDAILAQKQLVDDSITKFNRDIIQSLGQNVAGLQAAAKALTQNIQVEFKPIDVNINLGQDLQTFKTEFQNSIFKQVKSEIAAEFDRRTEGNGPPKLPGN